MKGLQGAISSNEIALSTMGQFPRHERARYPLPNAWFEFLDRMAKQNDAADRLNKEKYSPEKVERERRELIREMGE